MKKFIVQATKLPPEITRIRCFYLPVIIISVFLALTMFTVSVYADGIYMFVDEGGNRFYTNKPEQGCVSVRFPLIAKKKKEKKISLAGDPKSKTYDAAITAAGRLYSVDPDLIRAVIKVESNFNPLAVSPKGASGLMQLMPGTARELGVTDPFDPEANIHGGVLYLSTLLGILNNDLPLSLAAYNAGPKRVVAKKAIPAIEETRHYVRQILAYYEKLKGY